jgi:WD40-like Beta Propeller Repeat
MFARDLAGRGTLYPISGGEPRTVPGWQPDDIWIRWSADGRAAYVYHDEKTSATVFRLDVGTGKRERFATLAPGDPAGVTSIHRLRMTADGKNFAYSYFREQSDLFLVQGAR